MMHPPKGAQLPGKGMTNAQTRNSPNPAQGGSVTRGARQDPPRGAKLPGKGLGNSQTRNSPGNRP